MGNKKFNFNRDDVVSFIYSYQAKAKKAIKEDLENYFLSLHTQYSFVKKDMKKIKYHITLISNVFNRYGGNSNKYIYSKEVEDSIKDCFRYKPYFGTPIYMFLEWDNYLMFLLLIKRSNFSLDSVVHSVVNKFDKGKDLICIDQANKQCRELYDLCSLYYKIKKSEEEYEKVVKTVKKMRSLQNMIDFLKNTGFDISTLISLEEEKDENKDITINKKLLFTCHKSKSNNSSN